MKAISVKPSNSGSSAPVAMRPESLYFLFSPITRIKGIGTATAKSLARLLPPITERETPCVPLVRDLLFHLPVGIVDRRFTCPLREAPDGKVATFIVRVDEHQEPKRGSKRPYRVLCSNTTGDITLVFFHAHGDYVKKSLPVGEERVISGKVEHYDFQLQMPHPDVIAPVSQLAEVQTIEPVYPLTVGLTSRRIHKIVSDALEKLPAIEEWALTLPSPLEGEGADPALVAGEAGEGWSRRGYNSVNVDNARELRTNSTEVEKKLWNILRNRQLEQYKFKRQQPIGSYIVDFVCLDKMLVIELDGGQHADQKIYDELRTKFLEAQGYRVLRFWNNEVIENIEGVYDRIYEVITTPHPALRATLSLKGRGNNWPSFKTALTLVHNPKCEEDLSSLSHARSRLAYDELLANQIHLAQLRQNMQRQSGEIISGTGELTEALRKSLPYTLTKGQEAALKDISADMASGHRMGRLLQGDVGSGKTIVALLAMLRAVEQGLQAALMVPTELIAQQHYEVISELLARIPSPLEGEGGSRSEPGEGLSNRGYDLPAIDHARELRKNSTEVEKKMWGILRNRQLEQYKFRRQQPIGPYIVDFICQDKMLVVELEGSQHAEQQSYDERRTKFLESKGYRVLRFWNNEITENVEGVYDRIYQDVSTPHPALRATLPLKGGGIHTVLLTGSVKGKAREEVLQNIASGKAQIVIGTHALFQEKVEFKNLALVVIDEQHRFGVGQRMALSAKGNLPHILHMTATPIPRSLAMTLYGDMDCSYLREKPAGRKPITTRTIPAARYDDVQDRLKAALARGEKAYWICPLIESEEQGDKDIAAAKSRFTEFKARFGSQVGLIHGRMKKDARDAEMQKFISGKTKLLVATTVIEVGIDVRDATIMVIEQAERFGLSQLHQLRGRVGRGEKPSACVLLYNEHSVMKPSLFGDEISAATRLAILRETEDGFKISEEDLKLRGGGDLLGTRQSGATRFVFVDMQHHLPLLMQANEQAKMLIKNGLSAEHHTLLQLFGWE